MMPAFLHGTRIAFIRLARDIGVFMSKAANPMDVFAVVKAAEGNVVCAAHPTQARNPNYNPPFRQKGHADRKDPGSVLQLVGHAQQEEDGSYRIIFAGKLPQTTELVLKPAVSR